MGNFNGQLEKQLSLLRTINPNLNCSLDRVLNDVSVRHFVEIVILLPNDNVSVFVGSWRVLKIHWGKVHFPSAFTTPVNALADIQKIFRIIQHMAKIMWTPKHHTNLCLWKLISKTVNRQLALSNSFWEGFLLDAGTCSDDGWWGLARSWLLN